MNKIQKIELKVPVEVYSRVVGYYRPIQHWNPGKVQEYHDRIEVKVPYRELSGEA